MMNKKDKMLKIKEISSKYCDLLRRQDYLLCFNEDNDSWIIIIVNMNMIMNLEHIN